MEKLNVSTLPILDDFELFLTFLRSRDRIPLTNEKAQLKRNDLFCLNEEMHFKADYVTDKSMQFAYPALDFFFLVVLAGQLARIYREEKNNSLRANPEQLERFSLLSTTEQYVFLLETAWSRLNWAKLCEARSIAYLGDSLNEFFLLVATSSPGQTFNVSDDQRRITDGKSSLPVGSIKKIAEMFQFLGFYDLVPARNLIKKPDRYSFPFEKVIIHEVGQRLSTVLLEQRPLEQWNLPIRRELGLGQVPLGLTEEQYYQEESDGNWIPRPEDTLIMPLFREAFTPLFDPGELEEGLYTSERKFVEGTYALRVSLGKDLYRTIAIGATATLDDLHQAIQSAFKFGDDHLYAFFMDGEPWSDERFEGPRGSESPHAGGPFADGVTLGELDLYPGQQFLYLFDFGDQWQFLVTLLEINTTQPEPKNPKIIDKLGKNPEQYPDW